MAETKSVTFAEVFARQLVRENRNCELSFDAHRLPTSIQIIEMIRVDVYLCVYGKRLLVGMIQRLVLSSSQITIWSLDKTPEEIFISSRNTQYRDTPKAFCIYLEHTVDKKNRLEYSNNRLGIYSEPEKRWLSSFDGIDRDTVLEFFIHLIKQIKVFFSCFGENWIIEDGVIMEEISLRVVDELATITIDIDDSTYQRILKSKDSMENVLLVLPYSRTLYDVLRKYIDLLRNGIRNEKYTLVVHNYLDPRVIQTLPILYFRHKKHGLFSLRSDDVPIIAGAKIKCHGSKSIIEVRILWKLSRFHGL